MLVGFQHPRFSVLTALWNECLPAPYHISEDILRLNSIDSPLFDWGASVVEIDDDAKPLGFVLVKKPPYRLYKGIDPDVAHISAIVTPTAQMGLEMLAEVKRNLKNRGIYKVVFGQDLPHFFPGCPTDLPTVKDLLVVEGFVEGGECVDIRQDLAEFTPRESALKRLTAGPEKVKVGPVSADDVSALDSFMKREFPGRWRHDVKVKVKAEGRSDFVYALWVNGEVVGFAVTQDGSHKRPIGGAVFCEGLGENWCSLGPIGIAESVRGKGLGDVLLAASLADLKKRGLGVCTIDWTVLQDWYGKHGFAVSRRYVPFTLKLDEAI
jgi:GNAT superfamily N-acetyltransferase